MHASGQSGGYLDARPNRTLALTATVALHALVIAGLFLVRPQLIEPAIDVIPFIHIPAEPVTPPPPIEQVKTKPVTNKPDTEALSRPRQATSDASTSTTTDGGLSSEGLNWPEVDRGIKILPIDPPAQPVFVEAGIDGRYARDLQPPYPASMQRLGIEGSVTVRVRIGTDGRVLAVEPVRADDPAFFAATRDWALRKWRFRAATRDGVPVEAWLTKTVHFMIAT